MWRRRAGPRSAWPALAGLIIAFCAGIARAGPVPAASPTAAPVSASSTAAASAPAAPLTKTDATADCSLVTAEDAGRLLGYDVLPAATGARAAGTCFYASQDLSQDGAVTYTILTAARLVQLRPYFTLYARRCGNVASASERAPDCALAFKLARVADLDTYYAIRTQVAGAQAVTGLGSDAVSAGETFYVRRGALLFEAAIRRDDVFDYERTRRLAQLILERSAS